MAREITQRQRAEAIVGRHYECEDTWYSCPLSEDGCANDAIDKSECTCGLDRRRQAVNELLKHARQEALKDATNAIGNLFMDSKGLILDADTLTVIYDALDRLAREGREG